MKRFWSFMEKWGFSIVILGYLASLFVVTASLAFSCGKIVDDVNEITREVVAEVTSEYLITHWGN